MILNGIPISDDQCIGDSLQYINSAFQTLSSASIINAADTSTIDLNLTNRTLSASVIDSSITNSKLAFDGGSFAFRNKLINAQGLINQRVYVSGTATTTANQYTVDRWRVVTSGQNLAFSTTANVVTFTAPAGGVEQVVEGLNVESGTYVLNWTGTATATVDGVARAKGETFSLTGGTNVTVRFSSGTFSLPQLEKGTSATPFEHRPFGSELALCQRYFHQFVDDDLRISTYQIGGSDLTFIYKLPVTMRAAPTITQPTWTDVNVTGSPIMTATSPNTVKVSGEATNSGAVQWSNVGGRASAEI